MVDKDNEYNELNGKISSYEDKINSAANEIQILSDAKDELNKSIVEKIRILQNCLIRTRILKLKSKG